MANTYKVKVFERKDKDLNCDGFQNETNEIIAELEALEDFKSIEDVDIIYDDDRKVFRCVITYTLNT